jgi:hypothetical protein
MKPPVLCLLLACCFAHLSAELQENKLILRRAVVSPTDKFAISSLLLPTHGRAGEAYFERARDRLIEASGGEELAQWVSAQLDLWRSSGRPSREFKSVTEKILYDADATPSSFVVNLNPGEHGTSRSEACRKLSAGYFKCVANVMQEDGLSVDEARGIVSQAGVVLAATIEEQQSAARIRHNLTCAGASVGKSYRVPKAIMSTIGYPAELSIDEVKRIFKHDALAEPDLLADLSVEEAITYIGEIAQSLGCTNDIAEPLRIVAASAQRHDPYLVVLHYQLTTAVKYDSLLIDLYEFSPRSERVEWITRAYNEAGLEARSNPYLNNFKSVELLTPSWANTKQGHRFAAHALVNLIETLDGLAPLQRQTLGSLIRGLLHRILRVAATDPATAVRVPMLNQEQIQRLSEHVAVGNTSTLGIVEQRYVDAVAFAEKATSGDWREPRGLGDSVNASNLSRKKFGDIEFKHQRDLRIEAYEAHGGTLTEGYVRDHLSSLPYILEFRRGELEDRSSIENWTLKVTFVSHEFRGSLPENDNIGGLSVEIAYQTYRDFAPDAVDNRMVDAFNSVFVDRINAIQTPHRVRQAAHDIVTGVA